MTTPQIDLIYEAKTPLPGGLTLPALVAAYQIQITRDFAPIWGAPATLDIQTTPRTGVWRAIFLDDADQADALGYHELTPDGLPQAKIFVKTTLEDHENPTVPGSHELLEMLADPNIDQVLIKHGFFVKGFAKEVCDAVEETTYEINGLTMSNFQLPAWFGLLNPASVSGFDFIGLTNKPFQLLKGGYASIQLADGQWSQIFGSVHTASQFNESRKWRPQARESGVMRRSTR